VKISIREWQKWWKENMMWLIEMENRFKFTILVYRSSSVKQH
jgi:hypothetical protein